MDRRRRRRVVFAALLLVLLGCDAAVPQAAREDIAQAVRSNTEMAELLSEGYVFAVTQHTRKELVALAEQYPAIYGDLQDRSAAIAIVRFTKDEIGKLVVYDVERAEIIRIFHTVGVVIN